MSDLLPDEDRALPVARGKGLLELARGDCHWPIGDPATGNFFFCGEAAVSGLPYCARHCRDACVSPAERAGRVLQNRGMSAGGAG